MRRPTHPSCNWEKNLQNLNPTIYPTIHDILNLSHSDVMSIIRGYRGICYIWVKTLGLPKTIGTMGLQELEIGGLNRSQNCEEHWRYSDWTINKNDNLSLSLYIYIYIWRFPKTGVPLNNPLYEDFSWNKPSSYWGSPMTMETPQDAFMNVTGIDPKNPEIDCDLPARTEQAWDWLYPLVI